MSYFKILSHYALAGDVIDIKPKLKEKAEDKEKNQEAIKPDFSKARLKITTSSAYAGGYELHVYVPIAAEFLRDKKKDNKKEFITYLHEFVNERIGKWMGTPYVSGFQDRAKNGMLNIDSYWHFDDPYFAYALGLNLNEWRGSNDVVEKSEIAARYALAEKAMKELDNFRSVATKKLKLRSQDKEEQNKIWKEEFMNDWVDLDKKWRDKGISYTELKQAGGRSRAVGSIAEKYMVSAGKDTPRFVTPKLPKYKMTDAFDHAEVWLNAAYEDVQDLIEEVKKLDSNHPLLKRDGHSLVSLKEKIGDVVIHVRTFQE